VSSGIGYLKEQLLSEKCLTNVGLSKLINKKINQGLSTLGGRDSSVGLATGYGLNGPGIESRKRREFSHTSRPKLGPTQPTVQLVPGFSRR
jgi:hypothetical protein